MESVNVRDDYKRVKKNKRMHYWWVGNNDVCNCWDEWGELAPQLDSVCVCGSARKRLCLSDECDCAAEKWSSCEWVYVLDAEQVESGRLDGELAAALQGLRGVRL